jgi:hypothetical protein
MSESSPPPPTVGGRVEDRCRICKSVTRHTVMALAADGSVARVICGGCGSQHNYRGGEPAPTPRRAGAGRSDPPRSGGTLRDLPFPLVSERERSQPPMTQEPDGAPGQDLELLLRRIIREESGLTPVAPAARWRGGQMILRPGQAGLQEKAWPIETFFHKIVMLRNRLRSIEQQINAADLPEDLKVKLQGYITGCYGSLTSFNILFAEEEDRFRGAGGKG